MTSIRSAVVTDLEQLPPERAASALAITALALAGELDSGELPGTALAAVARELRAAMTELMKSSGEGRVSGVDDLRAKRAKRRSG